MAVAQPDRQSCCLVFLGPLNLLEEEAKPMRGLVVLGAAVVEAAGAVQGKPLHAKHLLIFDNFPDIHAEAYM